MLKIVKIGGNIVDNPVKLRAFLADFAALDGDKILVHGGGKVATAIAAALGIETTMIEGRRVTDARTLEVVTMVYNGINKQIISMLQRAGCNAAGLCGADGRLIVSRRRAPEPIDYGFVGDPVAVNTAFAHALIAAGHTLVIAPITLDGSTDLTNSLLNTNADTVAQTLATALVGNIGSSVADSSVAHTPAVDISVADTPAAAVTASAAAADTAAAAVAVAKTASRNMPGKDDVELIYCFEKQGVMLDVDDDASLIPYLDRQRFAELKAIGAVHSGMLPKLENAFRALEKGVARVVICAAENIAKPSYGGTIVTTGAGE
jgi:acetylglutamate kinase